MSLIDHLEGELGRIEGGLKAMTYEAVNCQVLLMSGGRYANINAFSTLGLSGFGLKSMVSAKEIFQELFMLMPREYGHSNIGSLMIDIMTRAISLNQAYLRGEVIDFNSGFALLDKKFTSFYVAPPVYFPDSFAVFHSKTDDKDIVLCWLIPIYGEERRFIIDNGFEKFEELVQNVDPDFFDLERKSIVQWPLNTLS